MLVLTVVWLTKTISFACFRFDLAPRYVLRIFLVVS